MSVLQQVLLALFGVVVLVAALKLFTTPLRLVLKLLLNTALGFVGLLVFNLVGGALNLSLGLNLFNAAVIAVLGLPGFALLLLLQWLFGL
ncbi:MAG: pro-sigmaK processing inhibitor BofA family protein [Oscillospiraceae bacterium]|jgi:inhibitor of the pro-sigma K processing machinery|nr:pro-sigmaK processing inhibitor BofA family protein [Oscillospiraceae bacterium]